MAGKKEKEKEKKPNAIQRWWRETVGELRKVTWPTLQEAWRLTVIVLIVMVAMSAVLGPAGFYFLAVDYACCWRNLTSTAGAGIEVEGKEWTHEIDDYRREMTLRSEKTPAAKRASRIRAAISRAEEHRCLRSLPRIAKMP